MLVRKIVDFLLFSNIFIAVCAVIMGWQTTYLYSVPHHAVNYYWFLFFATVASYSGHWYLTETAVINGPRIQWLSQYRWIHVWLFFIGASGTVWMAWPLKAHWFWIGLAALPAFLYSAPKIPHPFFKRLRKIAFDKTFSLALVWTYATTLLPMLLTSMPFSASFYLFLAGRFLLIYGVCMLFDYRDKEHDKKEGILVLLHFLTNRQEQVLFYGVVLLFFAVGAVQFIFLPLHTVFFLMAPGCVLAILFKIARKNFSDYLYYGVLDGLMMLSGFLMFIWNWIF